MNTQDTQQERKTKQHNTTQGLPVGMTAHIVIAIHVYSMCILPIYLEKISFHFQFQVILPFRNFTAAHALIL